MDKKPGEYLICNTALAPLRQSPSELAEMETQALFGEKGIVHQKGVGDWIKVQLFNDHYIGWTDQKMFTSGTAEQGKFILIDTLAILKINNQLRWLPFGSFVDEETVSQNPDYSFILAGLPNSLNITELALSFMNAPYLWGGKSLMGIDCSGFVQCVMAAKGVQLARNASQQAMAGDLVSYMHRNTGDLAFFRTTSNKISHVGIVIEDMIIHAHGQVRMDPFWPEGIFNTDKNEISHQLVAIKRITQLATGG